MKILGVGSLKIKLQTNVYTIYCTHAYKNNHHINIQKKNKQKQNRTQIHIADKNLHSN
ncbi:unnamed protein product [Tenebrio molitor]|nr:unnamed protein product [Tenebrio molitor]